MTDIALPSAIEIILDKYSEPEAIFSELVPKIGEILQSDRCFLYVRNPETKFGRVVYCWRRTEEIPENSHPDWKLEPASLAEEDPLFAAALRAEPSIYVEDVETASPEVLNQEFERRNFGHRALIHAHLREDGKLWGILQPCIFGHKRIWSEFDRAFVTQIEHKLKPLVRKYVNSQ